MRLLGSSVRHPVADLWPRSYSGVARTSAGPARSSWPSPSWRSGGLAVALAGLVSRFIARPALGKWRRWHYQRHWAAVMTIGRLAPVYRGRLLLPVLGKVTSTRYTDRVPVRLVSGQSAADFAARAENLAHGFGAVTCRVRTGRPGAVVLELVRRDALAAIISALPAPARADLGRCRSAAAKTARRGWSGCTALMCCLRDRPGRGRRRCCGRWSGPCSPPCGRAW